MADILTTTYKPGFMQAQVAKAHEHGHVWPTRNLNPATRKHALQFDWRQTAGILTQIVWGG